MRGRNKFKTLKNKELIVQNNYENIQILPFLGTKPPKIYFFARKKNYNVDFGVFGNIL
jgi:hypothetical protein